MYSKYLIFDFETTGIGDFSKQRAIQLAWIMTDINFNILDEKVYYIKGIEKINTNFHKNITIDLLEKSGLHLKYVIIYFLNKIHEIFNNNGKIISHNISFDVNILNNEMRNLGMNYLDLSKYTYCTKKNTVNLCKILMKNKNYFKYQKLSELYYFLFKKKPVLELHDAMNDTKILYECCKELKKLSFL